jgi:ElaB/YqjD/DUF883 family membrane-anchored ribosome-binding protein
MTMSTTAEQLNGAAREAGARAEESLRRKASQLQKFFDDVEDLLSQVSSMEGSEISRLRNRIESSLDHVKAAARGGVNVAVEGTRTAALATDQYVHRNPWYAIGATAICCLALGAILRGSSGR